MIIKERLEEALNGIRFQIQADVRKDGSAIDFMDGMDKSPPTRC
jgi:hypothetical protein